jgi:ribosomal subunit interface protein
MGHLTVARAARASAKGGKGMQVSVTGRHVELGDALESHVRERLLSAVAKYFSDGIEAHVVFSREARLIGADITVHVGSGITHQSHAEADQAAASFDLAADKLEKRMRRHKRRLRDHRKSEGGTAPG